jgi:hypothetical protein
METMRQQLRLALLVSLGAAALVAFPHAAGGELQPGHISPTGASASAPRVDSDGAGTVIAAWREVDGDQSSIRASVRSQAGAWSPSQRISAPSVAVEEPELAVDRRGNAVAVWHRSTTGRDSFVEAATRPAGGSWSAAEQISPPGETAYRAAVAVEAGRATIVYTALTSSRQVVRAASRSLDGPWAAPATISDPASNAYTPNVAMDDAGGAVAVWQWFDGAWLVVQAAVRPAGSGWNAPETLSGPGQNVLHPQVAMDAEGNAAAAWLRSNGSWVAPQAAMRTSDGAWTAPSTLSTRGGSAATIDLAMNRRGDAVVLWKQGRGAGDFADLWSAFRPADASRWSGRVLVSEGWGGLRAQIDVDEQLNATAVWSGSQTISASFRQAGQTEWQDDYLLSSWEDATTQPAVTIHAPRNATAIWLTTRGEDDRVQAVSYDVTTSAEETDDEEEEDGDEEDEGEVFHGTIGADRLVGTPGDDVFFGYAGADRINGRGGRDVIYGGEGNDVVAGGRGRDRLFGGEGRDRLFGGPGSDVIIGDTGRDRLHGGRGNDALLARDGLPDVALGSRGRDRYRLDRWLDRARSVESRY